MLRWCAEAAFSTRDGSFGVTCMSMQPASTVRRGSGIGISPRWLGTSPD